MTQQNEIKDDNKPSLRKIIDALHDHGKVYKEKKEVRIL